MTKCNDTEISFLKRYFELKLAPVDMRYIALRSWEREVFEFISPDVTNSNIVSFPRRRAFADT